MTLPNTNEPLESLEKNVHYLYNAGLFHLTFAYIIYSEYWNQYRLILYDDANGVLIDKWFKTIQGAKIETVRYLLGNRAFKHYDPVWNPMNPPWKQNWINHMKVFKKARLKLNKSPGETGPGDTETPGKEIK